MEKRNVYNSSSLNGIRREVMLSAWRMFRSSSGTNFRFELKEAWARQRRMVKTIASMKASAAQSGGVLSFSSDLTRSPIRRAIGSDPYAGTKARRSAYLTARLGR
jgi:hypothetical protein